MVLRRVRRRVSRAHARTRARGDPGRRRYGGAMRRALALAVLGAAVSALLLAGRPATVPAPAAAAAAPAAVRVLGVTEGLAVDGPFAFVIRRRNPRPVVVRVDLRTGRRAIVFRTDGFPDDVLYAGGGRVAVALDLPGADEATAVASFPAAGGPATVRTARLGPGGRCGEEVHLNGITDAGMLVDTVAIPCGGPGSGRHTGTAVGPAGGQTRVAPPGASGAPPRPLVLR